MVNSVKEWKSIDEQIALIRGRGMIVDDEEQAQHLLRRVGYYRLSGYWYPFRQFDADGQRADNFIDGSQFQDVVSLYLFDRKLRLLALDAIERIELSIQVEIAHMLGCRDPYAHENPDELHGYFTKKKMRSGETLHYRWLEGFHALVRRSKRKPFVAHNLDKYGRLPIWAAIEVFDFGTMSKLYAGLKITDKIAIEKQFGLNEGKHLQAWLRSLNFIRNTSAHQSRLWNCNVLERASVPRSKLQLNQLINSRPFLYFCIMQTMMQVVCPNSSWKCRFLDLLTTFPHVENGAIQLGDMGVVDGWENWNLWK
ncbi:MAG: abortive phage resistance protein [Robiginitomaculum sp.]|nr:MAG: abortive phage resistance protein [Robiginitomaculum sp.]